MSPKNDTKNKNMILNHLLAQRIISLSKESAESGRGETMEGTTGKRYGSVIKVRPEKLEEYVTLHKAVWPEILSKLKACHITNYSIYYKDGYLFSYYEYIGEDYASDMQAMKADEATQKWWQLTDPCQEPLESRLEGEWWASMEEVFHMA